MTLDYPISKKNTLISNLTHLVRERNVGITSTEEDELGIRGNVEAIGQRIIFAPYLSERNL